MSAFGSKADIAAHVSFPVTVGLFPQAFFARINKTQLV
jgi:hypothetical protein